LKIWIASHPRSTPRSTARASEPAGDTCAPISIGEGLSCVHRERDRAGRENS
jgi:hypothetical protein